MMLASARSARDGHGAVAFAFAIDEFGQSLEPGQCELVLVAWPAQQVRSLEFRSTHLACAAEDRADLG